MFKTLIKIILATAIGAFACVCASAQSANQSGGNFVDLTIAHDAAPAPAALKDPPSCPAGSGGEMGFGMPEADDRAPRELQLEITKISNAKPVLDDDVTAEIRVTNAGSAAVAIPWSADPRIVRVTPGAIVAWTVAEIDMTLRSPKSTLSLDGPSRLYAVASQRESWKTLAPGESATVRVGFKIRTLVDNDLYPVTPGKWELDASWRQARRSLASDECSYKSEWVLENVKNDSEEIAIEIPQRVIAVKPPAPVRPPAPAPRQLEIHVTLGAATDGIDFDSRISDVTRRVLRSAQLALSQQKDPNLKADFTARFVVMKDGTLAPESVAFVSGSADDATRDALLQSIRDAAPFQALPVAFDRKSIAMQVKFTTGIKPK